MTRTCFVFYLALLGPLFLFPNIVFSQEQLGMRLERRAGMYAAAINPANTAINPNNWEVSLFLAEAFFQNNYAYLQSASLTQALRNSGNIVSVEDTTPENPPPVGTVLLDFFDGNRPMQAVVQARVTGPAFSCRLGDNSVIGTI
jgi:hypothetical protein